MSTTVRIAPIDEADAVAAVGGMFVDEFSCDQVTDRFLLETYGTEDAFEKCEADVSRNRTSDKMASAKVLVADSVRAIVRVRSTSGTVAKVEVVRDGERLRIDEVVPVD